MSKLRPIVAGLMCLMPVGIFTSMAVLSIAINGLTFVALAYWLYMSWKKKSAEKLWLRLGPDILLWLYWLVVIIGAIFIASIPDGERLYVAAQGKWVLFLYAISTALVHFKISETRIVQIIIYLCIPVALHGLYQALTGDDFVRHAQNFTFPGSSFFRARGFNHNPMTFGHLLAISLAGITPFLIFRVFKITPRFEKILIASYLLGFTALVLTFTRGAWLATAGAIIIMTILWNHRYVSRLIAILVVLFLPISFLSPTIGHRVMSIGDLSDHSTQERFLIWKANWIMFLKHPILGVGSGRNRAALKDLDLDLKKMITQSRPIPDADAHNSALQTVTGTGIFGFLFWLSAMAWFFVDGIKRYKLSIAPTEKAIHLGFVGAFIAFHVGGLTQSTFYDSEVRLAFLLWLAISISTARKKAFISDNCR